jgi:hypothetical protein
MGEFHKPPAAGHRNNESAPGSQAFVKQCLKNTEESCQWLVNTFYVWG